jgi:hypothetical protein
LDRICSKEILITPVPFEEDKNRLPTKMIRICTMNGSPQDIKVYSNIQPEKEEIWYIK